MVFGKISAILDVTTENTYLEARKMNKPLEIFCTIMAWLLSIVLVATLIITPALFSFLSLLSTNTVTKIVSGVVAEEQEKSASYAQTVQVATLHCLVSCRRTKVSTLVTAMAHRLPSFRKTIP